MASGGREAERKKLKLEIKVEEVEDTNYWVLHAFKLLVPDVFFPLFSGCRLWQRRVYLACAWEEHFREWIC